MNEEASDVIYLALLARQVYDGKKVKPAHSGEQSGLYTTIAIHRQTARCFVAATCVQRDSLMSSFNCSD